MIVRFRNSFICLLLLLPISSVISRTLDVPAIHTEDGKALKIDLNEEHSLELLQHWLDQAMSGLMAAIATNKLEKVPKETKNLHEYCSKNATTVTAHAKCVVQLMDDERKERKRNKEKDEEKNIVLKKNHKSSRSHRKLRKGKRKNKLKRMKEGRRLSDTTIISSEKEWIGGFKIRDKRSIISKSSYSLHSPHDLNPFSTLAKSLTKTVRQMKKKDEEHSKDWKEIIDEVQVEGKKLKARKLLKKMFAKRLMSIQNDTVEGNINSRRPLAMKELDDIDESDPKLMLEEARKMERKLSKEDKIMRAPLKLIREAVKIGMMVSGKNVSGFDDKTLKLFSPRMMSVVPEEESIDEFNFLSPSLFSLHKEGNGIERATSLVDGFGLIKDRHHEEWLNFVMEAAGVSDAVEYLKDEKIKKASRGLGLDEEEMISPSGQPLYFTKDNVTKIFGANETKKIDIFEELQGTYTQEQIDEQKRSGYFIMTPEQLRLIYGPGSPYYDEERLKTLTSIPTKDLPHHIEENIRTVSRVDSFNLRKKDVILAPVVGIPLVFQSALLSGPVILSPLVFSPSILSPAIFGPVILGPWVFIPVILSPRVFSPLILNPLIFSPIVLSPLIAHPLILSPGVFNPIVLSPLVLSPFILSPQVFTPLILSPFVLNPLILNPMVGSPLILSPFVLSPIILSPQYLFAVVLSPYVLSPLIQSELNGATVALSPSVLS